MRGQVAAPSCTSLWCYHAHVRPYGGSMISPRAESTRCPEPLRMLFETCCSRVAGWGYCTDVELIENHTQLIISCIVDLLASHPDYKKTALTKAKRIVEKRKRAARMVRLFSHSIRLPKSFCFCPAVGGEEFFLCPSAELTTKQTAKAPSFQAAKISTIAGR